jgi:glycosyltransferase involved in cell wall biosynthesis
MVKIIDPTYSQKRFYLAMNQITIVIMVKNAEATLKQTLDSLKDYTPVLVLDTGSTDKTLEIVKSYANITFFETPFDGFGKTRNYASFLATTNWVLHLDADEIPSQKLLEEISQLKLDESSVYALLRDNYFWNKQMKGCSGWYPDWVVRLYNKTKTTYSLDRVHEKVIDTNLKITKLQGTLKHTPYQTLSQMLSKMAHYSDLFVQNTPKKANFLSPYWHGMFAFFKSYILKWGWTQGFRGFVLSKYMADTAFYKYLKLYEKGISLKD